MKKILFLSMAILALAGCKDEKPPQPADPVVEAPAPAQGVAKNPAMEKAQDWTRFFPELYDGIMACVRANPVPVKTVLNTVSMNQGKVLVTTVDTAGKFRECVSDTVPTKESPPGIKDIDQAPQGGTTFTPEGAGLPLPDSCVNNVAVQSVSGARLGWLSYRHCETQPPP